MKGLRELTIGIEEEYQLVDPESRQLTSYVQEFLEEGRLVLEDQIKPELMRSQIEVGSRICRSITEAREEVSRLRRTVADVAAGHGLVLAAASTHPFSSWKTQEITTDDRYLKHLEELADVARRMLIFGMHVHVGIEDKELRIDVMDQARYFMPHILALSTSSPTASWRAAMRPNALRTAARSTSRSSAAAATVGAAGIANCCGHMSSSGSSTRAASRRAMASRGPASPTPVSTGFITPTSIPRASRARASAQDTTVLPTPVSVPVTKTLPALTRRG